MLQPSVEEVGEIVTLTLNSPVCVVGIEAEDAKVDRNSVIQSLQVVAVLSVVEYLGLANLQSFVQHQLS